MVLVFEFLRFLTDAENIVHLCRAIQVGDLAWGIARSDKQVVTILTSLRIKLYRHT